MAESTITSNPPVQDADQQEAALRDQLSSNPADADVLAELGMLRADRGDFDEARQLLDRAIGERGDDPRLRLIAGGLALHQRDIEAASIQYREALLLRPNLPDAHVGLGQIADLRDQASVAEDHFDSALKADPDHANALLGKAQLLLDMGQAERAVQEFGQLIQRHPRHARGLAGYGQALMQRGTPEQAARPLKRALELDADLLPARLLLGHVELFRGNPEAAEQAYRAVLKAEPSNADALAGLGDSLRVQKRMQEAFLAYDAARRKNPDAEVLTTIRAVTLGSLGRAAEAEEDLRDFIGKHPRCRTPRLLLADMYRNSRRSADAVAMWQAGVDADADDALAWAELAMQNERDGKHQLAAEQARHSTADQRTESCLMRARCALRTGHPELAQPELKALKSKRLEPQEKRDRLRLMGLVHDRNERWPEAALAFREAQRIDASPLPALQPLDNMRTKLEALMAEPELQQPRVDAPILLLGLPGSGVELVAALLADQPGILVRDDRFAGQTDFFGDSGLPDLLVPLTQSRLGIQARRYARSLERQIRRRGAGLVVDWIPLLDARSLPAAKLALPGVRAIVVDCAPQLAWLRWLAFGWERSLRIRDSNESARWFAVARQQIEFAAQHLPVQRVDADALLANPATAGADLAAFLGLDDLKSGANVAARSRQSEGLVERFVDGHQESYQEALGEAFAALS